MLEPRAERRDVGRGERSLESVQYQPVGAVADSVYVLYSEKRSWELKATTAGG